MTNIIDVAKYISLKYRMLFNDAIDEMKLHKLLYFAQREYLAKYNEELFKEKFEAWTYGPVSVDVRNNLQDIISNESEIDFDGKEIVDNVILQYAPIDSIELSKLSHKETSWKNAHNGYDKFEKCTVPLSIEDIKFDGKNNNDQELFANEIDNDTKEFIDSIDESELTEFEL